MRPSPIPFVAFPSVDRSRVAQSIDAAHRLGDPAAGVAGGKVGQARPAHSAGEASLARKRGLVRKSLWLLCFSGLFLLLSSCAPGSNDQIGTAAASGSIAGFWLGCWHGLIAPVTFVVSLFSETIGFYEVHNNGNWYNAGFLLGIAMSLGGGGRHSASLRGLAVAEPPECGVDDDTRID